ncbi:hypothetical protein AB0K40_17985 [Nonomuraea bangladeshensis]|uniref:Uncharacterized protein n=1 Tax=Nonomuraea bangladeshensis TaxID=404385 RepID=A0ABV3H4Y5_9ACTN
MTRPCTHWNGAAATRCGATPARLYLPGWRCPAHTPAAMAGQEEPGRTAHCPPARCWCGTCPWWTDRSAHAYASLADSWVTDARHIASGKRRASPTTQAAAKQTVAEQKARNDPLRTRT